MVGMKPKEKEDVMPTTEKCKTFGTVSASTTKANQDEQQVIDGATANQEKTISLELGDLMPKLEQIDKKLKYSEKDRQEIKSETRHNLGRSVLGGFRKVLGQNEVSQHLSEGS